jgi:hypothetical protein
MTKLNYMKALISLVLVLGLLAVSSCRKEVQTASPSALDTISNTDSMSVNSNSVDTITAPSQTAADSTALKTTDSIGVSPRE